MKEYSEKDDSGTKLKGWLLVVLIYCLGFFVSVLIFLITAYYFGWLSYEEIPEPDWWTALGIVVTLTLGILVINIYRESTHLKKQEDLEEKYGKVLKELDDVKSEISYSKNLFTLSTVLLDVTTEENSTEDMWEESLKYVEDLHKLGFMPANDIHRMSIGAWKQNNLIIMFKLRLIPYQRDNDSIINRIKLLSTLPYVLQNPDYHNFIGNRFRNIYENVDLFLSELDIKKNDNKYDFTQFQNLNKDIKDDTEAYAYAVIGRYLYVKEQYENSSLFFNRAINKLSNSRNWHHRYILMTLLIKQDFEKLDLELTSLANKKSIKDDYRYVEILRFFRSVLNIINNKKAIPKSKLNYLRAINLSQFDRFSMWNFYSKLKEIKTNGKNRKLIIQEYTEFYTFFGADDLDMIIENYDAKKAELLEII